MKQTEERDEAILASLKKLGPSHPYEIADDAGIDTVALKDAGKRLLGRGLIIAAGKTASRRWALPEQRIALADLIGAAKSPSTTAKSKPAKKRKAAKRKAKPAARRKPKRKYTRRSERRSIERPAGMPRPVFSAEDRAPLPLAFAVDGTFSRLRIALEEHLAAVTDAHQRLFGATAPDLAPIAT